MMEDVVMVSGFSDLCPHELFECLSECGQESQKVHYVHWSAPSSLEMDFTIQKYGVSVVQTALPCY